MNLPLRLNAQAGARIIVVGAALLAGGAAEASGGWRDLCQPTTAKHVPSQERSLTIDTPDGQIRGTLAGPLSASPDALVVMLHGYTGARNEIPVAGGEGMFTRTARLFAERGIASLRIDFIGSGQSDGDWSETRFSGQARDALRAAISLRSEHLGEATPLGVLGYSQGGLVALRAAAEGAPFDRVALWNPVMDPMATYEIIFGRDTILEAAQRHRDGTVGDVVGETRLRPSFFAELVAADPIADAAEVAAPVLIATGRRDPLVANGASLANQIKAARPSPTTVLDIDTGHDLGAIKDPPVLDAVIACTAGFLLAGSGT